jgi:hypothetical protein
MLLDHCVAGNVCSWRDFRARLPLSPGIEQSQRQVDASLLAILHQRSSPPPVAIASVFTAPSNLDLVTHFGYIFALGSSVHDRPLRNTAQASHTEHLVHQHWAEVVCQEWNQRGEHRSSSAGVVERNKVFLHLSRLSSCQLQRLY